jgi:small subunit ribosomal protein S6
MNEYEILLMLDPELSEERGEEIVARVRASVEGDGGTWDGHEPWGRRKLAYEIAHKGEGVYHLLLFTAAPATLAEISRVLKIDDGVMRHLAVRRVKGGQLKAPVQIAAVSASADDADGTPE